MTCPRIGCGGRLLLADIITREGEMVAFRCASCGNYVSGQILLNRAAPPPPDATIKRWGASSVAAQVVTTAPEPARRDCGPVFSYGRGDK